MWEILEALRPVHRGQGQRAIQRVTGHGRTTIRRWVASATELGWAPAVQAPDEELARKVALRMRPVAEQREAGESKSQLAPHAKQIRAWLTPDDGGRGLRLSKVHELLGRRAVRVPYSSLHRFATKYRGFQDKRSVTVRVADVAPGEFARQRIQRLTP